MSRPCSVCTHPLRTEVERELVNRSSSYRDLGHAYALSRSALSRHVTEGHIAERLARVRDEEDIAEALNVVRQLKAVNGMCGQLLQEAFETGDKNTVFRAADRVLRQLEFQSKLGGQLVEKHDVNVNIETHPQWIALRASIFEALVPYREARMAVLRAVSGIEERSNGR